MDFPYQLLRNILCSLILDIKILKKKEKKRNSTCFPSFHERRIRYEKHKKLTLTSISKEDNDLLSSWSPSPFFCPELRLNSFNFRGVIRKRRRRKRKKRVEGRRRDGRNRRRRNSSWQHEYLFISRRPYSKLGVSAHSYRHSNCEMEAPELHYFLWWIRRKGGARVCTSRSNYIPRWSPWFF